MNLSFKPIAAAVITACFISSPLVASAHKMHHRTFKPQQPRQDQPASINLLSPTTAFARQIVNANQTKGGPGVTINDKMTISGLLNVDAKASNRSTLASSGGFSTAGTNDIYVNNANLLLARSNAGQRNKKRNW